MFTFVTNATVRVAAQLLAGTTASVREAASDVEDVTVVMCRDEDATIVASLLRRAGHWLDRSNPPRPPRGGSRPVTPIVSRVTTLVASSAERPFAEAFTPEMDALVRRSRRR